MGSNDAYHRIKRIVEIFRTPIAFQLRIEHIAQPVQHDLFPRLTENPAIGLGVIVGGLGDARQGTARHQDETPAMLFDEPGLCLIGLDDVIKAFRIGGIKVVSACTAREISARYGLAVCQ
ncbi:hypothetical protein FQZ97_1089750 [compost metagenome]